MTPDPQTPEGRKRVFGECPSCLRYGPVKKDGTLFKHSRSVRTRNRPYARETCAGGKARKLR